ncbi:MAG: hypothetical protein R8F63_03680 [Acidimicrobiales bacterium]|nr:hypothetical protein [Acidimicrobiales bacterium]
MHRLLPLALAVLLVAAACGDDADSASDPTTTTTTSGITTTTTAGSTTTVAAETTTTTTTEAPKDELVDVGRGEYDVGVATITVTDAVRERPLTVDVWFPLAPDTTGDPHRYTLTPNDYYESPLAIGADAASLAPDGPFPLVIYSHGSGGIRFVDSDYTETIASHGYIVAAADHTGNTAVERITGSSDPGTVIALNRVQDVSLLIDAMVDPTHETAGVFAASVDGEHIAVTGHSFGGFTTYAVVSGYENVEGTAPADERVDAIIPLAPATGSGEPDATLLTDDDLARVDVPALVIVGTDDKTTPVDPNVERAWDLTASAPSYRLELVAAEHQSFTDLCDYLDFFDELTQPTAIVVETVETLAEEGCSEGDMALDRVQELTNTFAITFLESVFAGSPMILPETHEIPADVLYQVK